VAKKKRTEMVFGFLKRKGSPASDQVFVTSIRRRPEAVVVVLGWMGATEEEVQEYATLYHELQCSTVCATSPTMSLAMHDATTLGELAITAIRETGRLVRMGEWSEMEYGHVPIIIHVLSHGGAQLLEELERRLREVVSSESLGLMKDTSVNHSFGGRPMFRSGSTMTTSTRSISSSSASSTTEEVFRTMISSMSQITTRIPSLTVSCVSHTTEDWSDDEHHSTQRPPLATESPIQQPISIVGTPSPSQRMRRKRRSPLVNRFDLERNSSHQKEQTYNSDDIAYQRDMQIFASRLALGAIVFDSAPCFPSLRRELLAAETCLKSDPVMKMATVSAIASQQGMHGILQHSSLGKFPSTTGETVEVGRPEQFWRNLQELALTKRHAFIYGTEDKVCDPLMIKELAKLQRDRGMSVVECHLNGTGHLEHKRCQIDKYSDFLNQVLNSVCPHKVGEENEDDKWSDEDETGETFRVGEKKEAAATRPENCVAQSLLNDFVQVGKDGLNDSIQVS
jgi:Eukaryotic protein of unknown function (DUF829)